LRMSSNVSASHGNQISVSGNYPKDTDKDWASEFLFYMNRISLFWMSLFPDWIPINWRAFDILSVNWPQIKRSCSAHIYYPKSNRYVTVCSYCTWENLR